VLFNSQPFVLLFLPIVLGLYYAARGVRARQVVLVLASLVFYGYWDWRFVPALVALTFLNWAVAQWFGARRQRWVLILGIVLNLTVLGVCKYTNFFASNLSALLGVHFDPFSIILPLGVSFFTFQKISYLVDLYRGDKHMYGLLEFFAFVTFFPQLIAGPIVRHNEIMPQWRRDPHGPELWENMSRGLVLFTIGFAKKAGLADTAALVCDPLYAKAMLGPLNAGEAWAAAVSFALQVYFDFSGYSDMAIGLGLMFGLRIPFNFDAPFQAASLREFWRRWHMTLSRFLRDYVYIPLGGNRGGEWGRSRNVILTMLLGGLWHGAGWNTVTWGGLQGVGLAANGVWARQGRQMPWVLGWVVTNLYFVATLVVFRAPDFGTSGRVLAGMLGANGFGGVKIHDAPIMAIAVLAALIGPTSQDFALKTLRPAAWMAVPAGFAIVGLLLLAGGRVPNEFIYFQF
jgi:alginate O-acetyltransferase complex protein AlgI